MAITVLANTSYQTHPSVEFDILNSVTSFSKVGLRHRKWKRNVRMCRFNIDYETQQQWQ